MWSTSEPYGTSLTTPHLKTRGEEAVVRLQHVVPAEHEVMQGACDEGGPAQLRLDKGELAPREAVGDGGQRAYAEDRQQTEGHCACNRHNSQRVTAPAKDITDRGSLRLQ